MVWCQMEGRQKGGGGAESGPCRTRVQFADDNEPFGSRFSLILAWCCLRWAVRACHARAGRKRADERFVSRQRKRVQRVDVDRLLLAAQEMEVTPTETSDITFLNFNQDGRSVVK